MPLLGSYSSGYRRKAETVQLIRDFLGLDPAIAPEDEMGWGGGS